MSYDAPPSLHHEDGASWNTLRSRQRRRIGLQWERWIVADLFLERLSPDRQRMNFVLIAILFALVPVRVTMIDGAQREGSLRSIGQSQVELDVRGKSETLVLDQVLSIQRTDSPSGRSLAITAQLAGGSRVSLSGLVTEEQSVAMTLSRGEKLAVPLKQLRWVRFRSPTPAIDPQWLGLVDKPRVADVLVVRRGSDSLDEVVGVVESILPTQVMLNLDGDPLAAPIEKLEGLLFADAAIDATSGRFLIDDIDGSRWVAVGLKSSENDELELDLGGGLSYRLPLDRLAKLETSGSVLFLSTETPADRNYAAHDDLAAPAKLMNQWLGVQGSGNDLIMRADSHVEYRVDGDFSSFVGSANFDPSVSSGGVCEMRILLDDKLVWEQTFDVSDPSPRGYELPLGSARRIRIEVASGGDSTIGDTLRIRQPRLLK